MEMTCGLLNYVRDALHLRKGPPIPVEYVAECDSTSKLCSAF